MDIAEAIDMADPSALDSSEFQETDAVPIIDHLPKEHYLSDEVNFKQFDDLANFLCNFDLYLS